MGKRYSATARRYDTSQVVSITWQGDRIVALESQDAQKPNADGSELPYVAPGFVDLQINGYSGIEYCKARLSVEEVLRADEQVAAHGLTLYCPTITTHSFEVMSDALRTLSRACAEGGPFACSLLAIHLEGPYISAEDGPRGAHPKAFCRPPDWDEFQRLQEAAGGRVRLVTLSPEYPESCAFIERLVRAGVIVAIGHTAASPSQIRDAVSAGARLSTHLGNGCHLMLPRLQNYLWEQLADDRLMASLIVDGHHLPPSVVRCFVRAKTPQRCLLVSDITALGGMPPGRYETSLGAVEVLDNGKLVVAGQRQLLAGAARPIGDGIVNVMRFADVDLHTAVDMASRKPAELMGIRRALEVGAVADLVFFHLPPPDQTALHILGTVRAGEIAFGSGNSWYRELPS